MSKIKVLYRYLKQVLHLYLFCVAFNTKRITETTIKKDRPIATKFNNYMQVVTKLS